MKKRMVLVGASGVIGKQIQDVFVGTNFEIISVGKKSGAHQADIENRESIEALFKKIGKVDAIVCAAGDVAFAPFNNISDQDWKKSLDGKLMGQVNLASVGVKYLNEKGSITLVSGSVSEYPILGGVCVTVVNRAIEAFVFAAAAEMQFGIRINAVSPNMLRESEDIFGPFFPGVKGVPGIDVANAFKKSVMGIQTGQVFRVH